MSTVARNTFYNLMGTGIPLVLFLATIPIYIWLIGAERYGVLAIVWLVVGVFGLMDFGLGRAVTQQVAALAEGTAQDRRIVLGTAMVSNLAIGAIGAIVMLGAGYLTFAYGVKLDPALREEALGTVPLMGLGVPIVTTYSVLSGALQGREQFAKVNRIAIANSALFQCLPILVAILVGPDLVALVAAALASRLVGVASLWRGCRREFGRGFTADWQRDKLSSLLSFGSWVFVTGVVGTILVFSDRVLIGASLGAVAVTIYAVPLDASRRLAVISDSLANALFPRLANADDTHSRAMTKSAIEILFALATPGVALVIVLADPFMRLWLGEGIGSRSAPLLQILAIAAWANIFAKPHYAKLQAQGRPKAVALIAIAQIPFYLAALWFALSHFGLVGAAWVYLARNSIDFVMLSVIADGRVQKGLPLLCTWAVFVVTVIALQSCPPLSFGHAIPAAMLGAVIAAGCAWLVISRDLRARIVRSLRGAIG